MLKVTDLIHRYPDGLILDRVSCVLGNGEKLGLVGPNGSGKSTLLRILAGRLRPTAGSVVRGPGDQAGYLEQFPQGDLDRTVAEILASARPELAAARSAMETAAATMAEASVSEAARSAAIAAYGVASDRFEQLGGYELEHETEVVREGLDLTSIDPTRPLRTLSGGQKTRVALARLLLSQATILLLDEPTNYLDLPALLWLERFVAASPCAAIIVSHDRRFLDRTVTGILALNPETCQLTRYAGTYSDYVMVHQRERERQAARYQDQQERIAAVEREIGLLKGKANATEQRTVHFHYRKVAKGVARRAKVQERRLERFLASEEHLERPEEARRLYLKDLLTTVLPDDRLAVAAANLRVAYGSTVVLDGLDLTVHGGDRLALVGPNGSGKSTLLRALAGRLAVDGSVRLGDGVQVGYLPQEHPNDPALGGRTVLDAFRANVTMHEDEARAFLDKFLFGGDSVRRRVVDLSYGERAKLALAGLVASGANLLLLDEPTSHLDLDALERIETALAEYPGPLVVASHDRYFLSAIGVTAVLALEGGRLRSVTDLEIFDGR